MLVVCFWSVREEKQCEEVARIYTGMPVYTGILAKSPVFLWFYPYFCDFVQVKSVIELFDKQVNNALNVHNSQKDDNISKT